MADLADILRVYNGSDGDATKALFERLEAIGPVGIVAMNLFRASKNSARAKVYRGGGYRGKAYDRKSWAIDNLAKVLGEHGAALGLNGPDAWSTALHRDAAMPVLELALADVRRPKPKKADLFGPGDAIDPPNLPIGAGIGSFVLGTPRDGDVIAREFGMPAVNDSDRDQEANWGWPVEQVQTWREPVPSKGAQGFWHWQGGGLAQFVGAL
jgi:hypothetical protein